MAETKPPPSWRSTSSLRADPNTRRVDCLSKDRNMLLAAYNFQAYDSSAEHGKHLLTTSPMESTFVRAPPHDPIEGLTVQQYPLPIVFQTA